MWLLLAVITAAATAGRSASTKGAMRGTDEYTTALVLSAVAALLLAPLVVVRGLPPISAAFAWALLGSGAVNTLALVLIARAVHRSELSLVAPLLSFTPAFMLITSPLLLGEWPSVPGLLGLLAIVCGSYLLNLRHRSRGLLAPFRALLDDAGARLMLLVSFIFSLSATIDKVGVLASDPFTWGFSVQVFVALGVLPWALRARRRRRHAGLVLDPHGVMVAAARAEDEPAEAGASPRGTPRLLVLGGVLTGIAVVAQMTALTMTLAAYVIAVKRTSILFEVLLGRFVFGESGLRQRLLGVLVMIAGVLLITVG
jgi:drug/metabolite transporter (DMT)-like permease